MTNTLRSEFEPALISTRGCHLTPELCAESWDKETWNETFLLEQVARADAWLQQVTRTKHVNPKAGSSYGLKHAVESWWREQKAPDPYVANGCFIMAAKRLGFLLKPIPARYCATPHSQWDCYNAFLNVTARAGR